MRVVFTTARHYAAARKEMPWASVIARTDDGFVGFESVNDYRIWKGQK